MTENSDLVYRLREWSNYDDPPGATLDGLLNEAADEIAALRAAAALCEDCPPVGYPTDKTRCVPCPRAAASAEPAAIIAPHDLAEIDKDALRPGAIVAIPAPANLEEPRG